MCVRLTNNFFPSFLWLLQWYFGHSYAGLGISDDEESPADLTHLHGLLGTKDAWHTRQHTVEEDRCEQKRLLKSKKYKNT